MKNILSFFLALQSVFVFSPLLANNIQVANLQYSSIENTLSFDLSWDNAYNLSAPGPNNYHDMAYIFIKYKNSNGTSWEHMPVPINGHLTDNTPPFLFGTTGLGANLPNGEVAGLITLYDYFQPSGFISGDIAVSCTVELSAFVNLLNPSFKVFAIEMVNSAKHGSVSYSLGDGTSLNRFHQGNDVSEPYQYLGTGAANVGSTSSDINVSGNPLPVSVIPSSYFGSASYTMKYEITQEQYVDFLNCLNRVSQNEHTGTDISGVSISNSFVMSNSSTAKDRNGIRCDASLPSGGSIVFYCDLNGNGTGNENDDGQNIAANYLLPKDLMAYLDWAGLTPINEIEYEYLCRGSQVPVPNEYAWGSDIKTAAIIDPVGADGPNETLTNIGANGIFRRSNSPMRTGAAADQTTNRIQAGSAINGIMELSGNAAELVIGTYEVGDFVAITDGDGTISILGLQNQNWPVNMTAKGLASNSTSLNSVSHRFAVNTEYVSTTVRSPLYGGRGQLR